MRVFCVVLLFAAAANAGFSSSSDDDGKYHPQKYGQHEGSYRRRKEGPDGTQDPLQYHIEQGHYVPNNDRHYFHVHDQRELGRYVHVHIPYDGGYGPYFGFNIPYLHDGIPALPYIHDPSPFPPPIPPLPYIHDPSPFPPAPPPPPYVHQTDKRVDRDRDGFETVSSSSDILPYADQFEIPTPAVQLQYGFPDITPKSSNRVVTVTTPESQTNINSESPTTIESNTRRHKRSLFEYAQTPKSAELSTSRPRADNDGQWKIVRQEEKKQKKAFDYFFETENGIFADEAGKGRDNDNEGTTGVPYYQYIGDDGKVYRVEYELGEYGYIPKVYSWRSNPSK